MGKRRWLTDDEDLKYFKIEYPDFKLVTLQEKENHFSNFNILKQNFEDALNYAYTGLYSRITAIWLKLGAIKVQLKKLTHLFNLDNFK